MDTSSKNYKGFKDVLKAIAFNEIKVIHSQTWMTHREIQYLADALKNSTEMVDMPHEVHFLIESLKVRGLTHRARSFIAKRALSVIEDAETTQDIFGEF